MKKIVFASLLLGSLLGSSLAQAQAYVNGAVVINDRHSQVGVYYQQPPVVYYPRPAPVYYGRPVYYEQRYYRPDWHHHHHEHHRHYPHGGGYYHGGDRHHHGR